MKLYAVRHADDKQAVGFFWSANVDELILQVDYITEAHACEFHEIDEGAAFVWDGECPPLGVSRSEETAAKDLALLMSKVSADGAFLNFFYQEIDFWTPLTIYMVNEDVPRLARERFRENKPKKAKPPGAPKPEIPVLVDKVYFIQSGDHIKIGITSGPIQKRLKALSTAHHQDLVLLAVVEDQTGRMEMELHQRFASDRVRGEWFKASADLLAYIESIKK